MQRNAFDRTALYHVGEVGHALPLLAVSAFSAQCDSLTRGEQRGVYLFAFGVFQAKCQAGDAQGYEVVVIAGEPDLLLRRCERADQRL